MNLPVKHQPIEKKPRKEHGRAVTSPREADKEPAQLRGAAKEPAQLRGAGKVTIPAHGTGREQAPPHKTGEVKDPPRRAGRAAAVLSGIPDGAQHPLQAR